MVSQAPAVVMGIDIGTYESKGVLVDTGGTVVATAAVAHEMSIPAPGLAEHDADGIWWHDFVTICRELLDRSGIASKTVAALGCSGIGPCVLPVGEDGRPLRPAILYGIDTRASVEVGELSGELGEEWITSHTGAALSSQAAGPKILWLRRHEPDVWRRTARVMTSTSYLVSRLTGRTVIDHYTAAAYGPLYDLRDRDWHATPLELICDRAVLPDLQWSADVAGTVNGAAAAECGLLAGTPVVTGTADAAAEAIAAGVLEPGDTMLMYGTSLFFIQICASLPAPGSLWSTVYLQPGSYALAAAMSTAGALTRWFRDNFATAEVEAELAGGASAYHALADLAAQAEPGAGGLLVLPYFSGERTPLNDPHARGMLAGLNLAHSRAHIYRALLEGVAFGIRQNLEAMSAAGAAPRRLVAIGGGTRNPLWIQIATDVTQRTQVVQDTPGACYGDAVLAAVGVGLLPDIEDARRWLPAGRVTRPNERLAALYDERYELFRRLYAETRDIVRKLGE